MAKLNDSHVMAVGRNFDRPVHAKLKKDRHALAPAPILPQAGGDGEKRLFAELPVSS